MITKVFIFTARYTSVKDKGGCCYVGALGASASQAVDNYHRNCLCGQVTNITECRKLCSSDRKCKGYAQHSNSKSCVLATTALCPNGCTGPYNKDNVGTLDVKPTNCAQGDFDGGCYVKKNGNLLRAYIIRLNNHTYFSFTGSQFIIFYH